MDRRIASEIKMIEYYLDRLEGDQFTIHNAKVHLGRLKELLEDADDG